MIDLLVFFVMYLLSLGNMFNIINDAPVASYAFMFVYILPFQTSFLCILRNYVIEYGKPLKQNADRLN